MKQRLSLTLLTTGLLVLILIVFAHIGVFSHVQRVVSDELYGGHGALDSIVVVGIDDESLQSIGRWPWNRSVYVPVLDRLREARVVGMDIGFYEASEDDDVFKRAIDRHGDVVTAMEYTSFSSAGTEVVGDDSLLPVAGRPGYINMVTDEDGVLRAVNLNLSTNRSHFVRAVHDAISSDRVPSSERFLINYADESFPRVSFADVYNGSVNASYFDDKIVLIGATAPSLQDMYITPVSEGDAMPGVSVHANALQTLLTDDYLSPSPLWLTGVLAVILAGIVIAISEVATLWQAAASTVTVIVGYIVAAMYAFDHGVVLNLVHVPLAAVFAFGSSVGSHYVWERRRRRRTAEAFSKYVSEDLVEQIVEDDTDVGLGGESRDLTILFADIRGFTSIAEDLEAERLVDFLNEYLTEMSTIILDEEGTIDKFIGDAIMAFWNAPIQQENHATHAVETAIRMRETLSELQTEWADRGLPHLDIGIGLNTGVSAVGNMGSDERFEYTAMGDEVNLAARLEGLTKKYGASIIITEETANRIDGYALRELDRVRVKGKDEPVTVYHILGRSDDVDDDIIQRFEEALHLYYDQRFEEAKKQFEAIGDAPSQVFVERCETFQSEPPGDDWDGVWTMQTK